jgi:hypothetical protein
MSEDGSIVSVVGAWASGESATTTELHWLSGSDIIVPSSVFFPSSAAALQVTQFNRFTVMGRGITPITIPRHVQILCTSYLSHCESLSSVSFETESALIRIKSNAFDYCRHLPLVMNLEQ